MSNNPPVRRRLGTAGRILMGFLIVTLLAVIASGVALYFTTTVETSFNTAWQGNSDLEATAKLETYWQAVKADVDQILQTRQVSPTQPELTAQLEELNRQAAILAQKDLGSGLAGVSDAQVVTNRHLAEDLQILSNNMGVTVRNLIGVAQDGRWARAQVIRHTEMPSLERRFNEELGLLIQNLRMALAAENALIQYTQNFARYVFIGSIVLTLITGMFLGILSARRVIVPVRYLSSQIRAVAQDDLSLIPPLPQYDELARLTQDFAALTDHLREYYKTAEQRGLERTQELERRNTQVQVASQVARDIATARSLPVLLEQAVNLICNRFGYYQANIFLMEEAGEYTSGDYAVLRAAAGKAGSELLAREYKIRTGERGIVSFAATTGQPRIVPDVSIDPTYLKEALLPDTRSEVAIPLKVGDRLVGVLDVESTELAAFDDDTMTVLQIMADQLAIAIQNTRLLGEMQTALHELESFYQNFDIQTWQQIQHDHPVVGYRFDQAGITPVRVPDLIAAEGETTAPTVAVPLKVRGATIGNLEVWPAGQGLEADEFTLLEAVGSRVSQALESARLFEETRQRATREQLINELTAKISRSLDINTLLQTTLQELAQIPGVSEVAVHVSPAEEKK